MYRFELDDYTLFLQLLYTVTQTILAVFKWSIEEYVGSASASGSGCDVECSQSAVSTSTSHAVSQSTQQAADLRVSLLILNCALSSYDIRRAFKIMFDFVTRVFLSLLFSPVVSLFFFKKRGKQVGFPTFGIY